MTTADPDIAIRVSDACKSYGDIPVLTGLDMVVPHASIYGLLGPSGCGKTTLLNCIVGRSKLDSGHIYVKVKSKSLMGYMPQDLALFTQFTIEETLFYFGQVYGMNQRDIYLRMTDLLQFLDLPSPEKSVEILSGGQQRRVSLCVALLHDPQLLILDEPTVGVDPLLAHSIWQRLIQMCQTGRKTIVITTHYIEEARQAHTVGLLRNGTLLAEEEPNRLMQIYQSDTLERVFLLLSQRQSTNNNYLQSQKSRVPSLIDNFKMLVPKKNDKPVGIMQEGRNIHWCRIKGQLMKSHYWMRHNIPIMMFLICLPIVQSALFCLTVGRDPIGLPVGIVNNELPLGKPCPVPASSLCPEDELSCRYFHHLQVNKSLELVYYKSVNEAEIGVLRNQVWGFIEVPSNYSPSLLERIGQSLDFPDESIVASELNITMDMSNQYIGNLIKRDLILGHIEYLKDLYRACGWPAAAAGVPVKFGNAVYGDNRPSFAHFAVPAVIQLFEFYLPMMFTVGAILMEKRDGILERSLVTGISITETLIAHVMVQFVVLAVQTFLMMVVLFIIFDNPMKGSLSLCLALLFLIGVNGMCYGFFVSTLCDLDSAALYMGLGSFFPLAMLSGMVWPFEGMHWTLRAVGWFLPLTQTTESFRAITSRAWTLSHPVVYRGFICAAGWTAFFAISTYAIVWAQNGIKGSLRIPLVNQVIKRKY